MRSPDEVADPLRDDRHRGRAVLHGTGVFAGASMTDPKYTAPMVVGEHQVVRLRSVTVGQLVPGMRLKGWRLTHPNGKARLAPKDFLMESGARLYAKQQGWRVIGGSR
jgi:hypothetical protein